MQTREWDKVDELAGAFEALYGDPPTVMVVLGSGLGDAVNNLKGAESTDLDAFPHMPPASVSGHAGVMHRGYFGQTRTLVQQGRVHLYEGYPPEQVVRPIRAAIAWGVKAVVLTNAAGSLDIGLTPGRLMLIEDHLNLTGMNPLIGPNDEKRGPRFPALNNLYDRTMAAHFLHYGAERGVLPSTGVYAGLSGPSYETPAEVNMLAGFGAQSVGMSTVHEAIAARHLGAKIAGISCITNYAAGLENSTPSHEEVQAIGASLATDLGVILYEAISRIHEVI